MPITLKNIHYTYDPHSPSERVALRGIDLSFPDRCFSALIGRTGSGKSTIIQHLNGLLLPDSGTISVGDYTIDMSLVYCTKHGQITDIVDKRAMKKKHHQKLKGLKDLRRRVGIVFQFPEYQLFEESVIKDVAFGPKNFGLSEEESLKVSREALSLVGLDESYDTRSPFELSGGEKRRVAIAGILALHPDVLVLDEPTVGLDAGSQDSLMQLITSLHEKGKSIILATHDMDVVLAYCDRAIVLDHGKIVSDSVPIDLFRNMEFMAASSLEPPKVFSFAIALRARGLDIDLAKIRDVSSLASEIVRLKGGKIG